MNTPYRMAWISLLCLGLLLIGAACQAGRLILSEIAWAGTGASAHHEWIELQNRGDEPVALVGWEVRFGSVRVLLGEGGLSTVEARTLSLEPGAFLLLERTHDNTISDIEADVIYRGVLSNGGVQVELVSPSGDVVDSVDPSEDGWPAGTAAGEEVPYATMERTPVGGWVSNNGQIRNGLDAEGEPINGTPKQMNSAEAVARYAPSVELLRPSEEGLRLSGVVLLSWVAADPDGADTALSITVSVSADAGETWEDLVANLVNTGSFSWDTTAQAPGETYRLRVRAIDTDGYMAEALSPVFSLVTP
jgi:hypothetical protein